MKRLLIATAAAFALTSAAFAQTNEPVADSAATPPPAPAEAAPADVAPVDAAPAVMADAGAYQVLRPGDREMSCQQLSAEANALNAQLLAEQKEAAKQAKRSRGGRAVGGAVAGGTMRTFGRFGINRLAGSLGPVGFIAAHAVNDAASQATAEAIATGGQGDGAQTVKPEQQRMNHLLGIYKDKSC